MSLHGKCTIKACPGTYVTLYKSSTSSSIRPLKASRIQSSSRKCYLTLNILMPKCLNIWKIRFCSTRDSIATTAAILKPRDALSSALHNFCNWGTTTSSSTFSTWKKWRRTLFWSKSSQSTNKCSARKDQPSSTSVCSITSSQKSPRCPTLSTYWTA